MNKTWIIFLHIGYWALYLLLLLVIFVMLGIQGRRPAEAVTHLFFSVIGVAGILPNVISFYAFYFWLFPAFLHKKKIPILVIAGLAVSLFTAFLMMLSIGAFTDAAKPVFAKSVEFIGLLVPLTALAAIHGAIALVIRGFISWYSDIKLKEELSRKNHEMELALIRSRLDPHFLFNTINNIDVLMEKDTARASGYLNKLSDILRFTLYEAKDEQIALADELAHIEKYIELQKIRLKNPEDVSFSVSGDPAGKMVAPMLFLPFIENAFKHGGRGKIYIRFDITSEVINFECRNAYNYETSVDPEGIGNELIRRRLELIYPGKHSIEVFKTDGEYEVRIQIL